MARIALLAHKFWPSQGGTQRLVRSIGARLVSRGHEVTVLTSTTRSNKPEEWVDGMHVRRFGRRSLIFARPWYVTPGMLLEPVWSKYDLLHSFHFVTFQSLIAAVVRRTMMVPFVMTPSYHPWRGFYEEGIGTLTMRSADRVVAQCQQERRWLLRYLDSRKIVNIPCGIDSNAFRNLADAEDFRREHGIGVTDKVILYVGTLDNQKSVGELIGAMPGILARVPEATLVLIGGSSYQKGIIEQASVLGLSKSVRILGAVGEKELMKAYSLANVFAFASQHESFGIVLLEAAAAGVPIVSTRVGVAQELVVEGVTGFTVDNSNQFVARIIEVLSSEDIRENARRRRGKVLAEYDWEPITDSLEGVYRECMR